MKRLPMNPREDADVIRTGEFPNADEPPRPYVAPVCMNCRWWLRDKWPAKYVKQWGEAPEGECLHESQAPCFSSTDENGVEHFSKFKTGCSATCKHWEPK